MWPKLHKRMPDRIYHVLTKNIMTRLPSLRRRDALRGSTLWTEEEAWLHKYSLRAERRQLGRRNNTLTRNVQVTVQLFSSWGLHWEGGHGCFVYVRFISLRENYLEVRALSVCGGFIWTVFLCRFIFTFRMYSLESHHSLRQILHRRTTEKYSISVCIWAFRPEGHELLIQRSNVSSFCFQPRAFAIELGGSAAFKLDENREERIKLEAYRGLKFHCENKDKRNKKPVSLNWLTASQQ